MLLELARTSGALAFVRWCNKDIGCWDSLSPCWYEVRGRIRFQFRFQGSTNTFWVSSIKSKSWGFCILLSNEASPVPDAFEVAWQERRPEPEDPKATPLWEVVQRWMRTRYPGGQIVSAGMRADLAQTLSSSFLRVRFRYQGMNCLLLAAKNDSETPLALSQSLIWRSSLRRNRKLGEIAGTHILVPAGSAASICHRSRFLDHKRVETKIWEYQEGSFDIQPAKNPSPLLENRDFRWPVLGPFHWSPQFEKVLNLAPDCIRRYPRFHDYDSLRLWGLEFAEVYGVERNRLRFGVGTPRTELSDENFESLSALVREILFFRRPDSPNPQHSFYRLQSERWLESLILENISSIFPELRPESAYSQIPVYLGKYAGRIDILGLDRLGTLVVMELKVAADPDLPMQALDYWGRVVQHNQNGDFARRGYFADEPPSRRKPKIYLISPVFSFHDSTEHLLHYLEPDIEVWKIAINEDWRSGVKILRRVRVSRER
jgi:hypothetical protein